MRTNHRSSRSNNATLTRSTTNTNSSSTSVLFILCVAQFLLILYLVDIHSQLKDVIESFPIIPGGQQTIGNHSTPASLTITKRSTFITTANASMSQQFITPTIVSSNQQLAGVAVTLFLHSPTWFQRRYSIMVSEYLNS